MAKFFTILLVITLSVCLINAEPARFRKSRRNGQLRAPRRFFARQEQAPDAAPAPAPVPAPTEAPAPYPPAGVTPEVPFELPTETEAPAQPDLTYGPPDQTYGPPAPDNTYGPPAPEPASLPDNTYGPPAPEPASLPDNTYGPPDAPEDDQLPAIEEQPAAENSNGDDLVSQNLIQPRQKALRNSRLRAVPSRLRAATPISRARLLEIIRSEPVLVYTLN